MRELVAYDPHLVPGVLGGSAGTTSRRLPPGAGRPPKRCPRRAVRPEDQPLRAPAHVRPASSRDCGRRSRGRRGVPLVSRRSRAARHPALPAAAGRSGVDRPHAGVAGHDARQAAATFLPDPLRAGAHRRGAAAASPGRRPPVAERPRPRDRGGALLARRVPTGRRSPRLAVIAAAVFPDGGRRRLRRRGGSSRPDSGPSARFCAAEDIDGRSSAERPCLSSSWRAPVTRCSCSPGD